MERQRVMSLCSVMIYKTQTTVVLFLFYFFQLFHLHISII